MVRAEKRVPPPNGGHGFRFSRSAARCPYPYYLPHTYGNTEMPCVWVDYLYHYHFIEEPRRWLPHLITFVLSLSVLPYGWLSERQHNTPLPGFSLNESIPLSANSVSAPVRWEEGRTVRAGTELVIVFHLLEARVYSFQFKQPA